MKAENASRIMGHAHQIPRSAAPDSSAGATAVAVAEREAMTSRAQLLGETRYVIRLCQRTARLYRRVQTFGIFVGVAGGSAAVVSLAGALPASAVVVGGLFAALSAAALVAVRPADKAALNESDVRRYQALMARAARLDDAALAAAIDEARIGDAPEIELLRNVAYNDVAVEFNRPDAVVELSPAERLLRCLA